MHVFTMACCELANTCMTTEALDLPKDLQVSQTHLVTCRAALPGTKLIHIH